MILIGRAVSLRRRLRWFDRKPLFGRRIVVTRAADQAPDFTRLLEEAGAEVWGYPTIEIVPPRSWTGASPWRRSWDAMWDTSST